MNNEFEGKSAIVTGASSGIGEATARLLSARGARVTLFARNADRLAAIAGDNQSMSFVAGDVALQKDIEHLFESHEASFGACDILINNAGMIDVRPMLETEPEAWDRMFAVNVRGAYLASRRALPSMLQRRSGTIVNVSSISGVPGPEKYPGYVSYCASKAALILFTEALAVEVKGAGVRVNCISPGAVDTKMWAEASGGAAASMTPEEIAEAIAFLASARSRPMNGQNLDVYSA